MTPAEEMKEMAKMMMALPKEQEQHHDSQATNHPSTIVGDTDTDKLKQAPVSAGAKQHQQESLPYWDELWKNPLEFSLTNEAVSLPDNPEERPPTVKGINGETAVASGKDNVFCNPMMMMNHHGMAQHGVASMPEALGGGVGGDMSKGMIMYMDGFRFAMAGNQPCLNLYFPSWTLDTRSKFVGSLILVFLLSFATEGISKFRHTLSSRPVPGRERLHTRRIRQAQISALHGVQALLGYVVMLATMTFSVEILLSVVLGLSSGYYYYFAGEVGLEGHVTTNPCCSYMQNESDDQAQRQQQHQQSAIPLHQSVEETTMTTSLLLASPAEDTALV